MRLISPHDAKPRVEPYSNRCEHLVRQGHLAVSWEPESRVATDRKAAEDRSPSKCASWLGRQQIHTLWCLILSFINLPASRPEHTRTSPLLATSTSLVCSVCVCMEVAMTECLLHCPCAGHMEAGREQDDLYDARFEFDAPRYYDFQATSSGTPADKWFDTAPDGPGCKPESERSSYNLHTQTRPSPTHNA